MTKTKTKTKKDIVEEIARQLKQKEPEVDIPQVHIKEVVQLTFDQIRAIILEQGRIELRNFGVFEVKRRKARRARNPVTNDPVQVEAKLVVTFQPGKKMEDEVRDNGRLPVKKPKKSRKNRPIAIDPADVPPSTEEAALIPASANGEAEPADTPRTRKPRRGKQRATAE